MDSIVLDEFCTANKKRAKASDVTSTMEKSLKEIPIVWGASIHHPQSGDTDPELAPEPGLASWISWMHARVGDCPVC